MGPKSYLTTIFKTSRMDTPRCYSPYLRCPIFDKTWGVTCRKVFDD